MTRSCGSMRDHLREIHTHTHTLLIWWKTATIAYLIQSRRAQRNFQDEVSGKNCFRPPQKCKIEIPTPKSFWEKSQRSETREPSPRRARLNPASAFWLAGKNRTRDVIGGTRCLSEMLEFYWWALRVVYNKDVDYRRNRSEGCRLSVK